MDASRLAEFPDEELSDGSLQLAAAEACVLRMRLAFFVAQDRRETWRADGSTSMQAWLAYRLSVSYGTAAEWLRVGHAFEELPAIAAAFEAGRLSWDQVRVLTRFATADNDALWAERAPETTLAALHQWGRHAVSAVRREAELAEDDAEAQRTRNLNFRPTCGGRSVRFWGKLPAAEGELLRTAVDRIVDSSYEARPSEEEWEPIAARRADAMCEMASLSLGADADPDRATVVAHLIVGDRVEAALDGGAELSMSTLERLACDCRVEAVSHGPDGGVLGVGRLRRTPPPWLRRQLRWRDGGCCVFPGCRRRAGLHAHHLQHWVRGGATDLSNLALVCRAHHRLVHEGGWRASQLPDGRWRVESPDGRVVEVTGPPRLRNDVRQRLPLPEFDDPPDTDAA